MEKFLILFTALLLCFAVIGEEDDGLGNKDDLKVLEEAEAMKPKEIIVKDEKPFHTAKLGCRQGTALGCVHYARYMKKIGKPEVAKKFLSRACGLGYKAACESEQILTGKMPEIVAEGLVDKSTPVPTYGSEAPKEEDSMSKMYTGGSEEKKEEQKRDPSADKKEAPAEEASTNPEKK